MGRYVPINKSAVESQTADEQKRIFDRFYRAKNARGAAVRGSGIGLSLVKHIAEAHGGSVAVASEPGRGAQFIIAVPVLPVAEPAAEPARALGASQP